MTREIDEVKYQVAIANRTLDELGLSTHVTASLGHVSMRVPNEPDLFVVKGRGYAIDALARVTPEDMIVVDVNGNMIDGPRGTSQCYEVMMHSCILRERPDVNAVVHVHPRFTVLMSLLNVTMRPMCNEGREIVQNPLPVFEDSRLILNEDDGMNVVKTIGEGPAALLRGHGAVCAGRNMEAAVMTMLNLEEQARMNYYAYAAEGPDYKSIPDAEIAYGKEAFRTMGDLPHLKGPLSRGAAPGAGGRPGGVWAHYTELVKEKSGL
jgi:ribulose-5-phosphate 4-epimerase/fuculose-1-phosphate aldolase